VPGEQRAQRVVVSLRLEEAISLDDARGADPAVHRRGEHVRRLGAGARSRGERACEERVEAHEVRWFADDRLAQIDVEGADKPTDEGVFEPRRLPPREPGEE